MAKKLVKPTAVKNDFTKKQPAILKEFENVSIHIDELYSGTEMANFFSRLEGINGSLKKQFTKINNASAFKAARQAKFTATRIKLLARLEALDEKIN